LRGGGGHFRSGAAPCGGAGPLRPRTPRLHVSDIRLVLDAPLGGRSKHPSRMNERYALPIALIPWSAAQAQFPALCPPAAAPSPVTHILEDILPAEGELRAGGDVVFYEDFANGAAGNNGVGEWTTSGPHGNIWRRSTTGPNGAYTSPTSSRIQSATATNGFMMFASDSANTNWSTNPPTIVADPIPFEGSLVSPLLDLSATPYVELVFQQRGR